MAIKCILLFLSAAYQKAIAFMIPAEINMMYSAVAAKKRSVFMQFKMIYRASLPKRYIEKF